MSRIVVLAFLLSAAMADRGHVPYVNEHLKQTEEALAEKKLHFWPVEQLFFHEVSFFTIDTVQVVTTAPIGDSLPQICVAVDDEDNVYRISGFSPCDFNDIPRRFPLSLDMDEVYAYGQFYLDITRPAQLPYRGFACYAANIDELLQHNRHILNLPISGRCVDKTWNQVEQEFRSLCADKDLDHISYDTQKKTYYVDFWVWMRNSGDLYHIVLQINRNGVCEVETQEVVGRRTGFWYEHRM